MLLLVLVGCLHISVLDLDKIIMIIHSDQLGGWSGAVNQMFSADPEFAMGKIMTNTLEVHINRCSRKNAYFY